MRLPFSFGIRGQVLLIALVLLAIPWIGYRYLWQVEKFLRQGQEKALAGTARALATALHDRPQLFEPRDEEDRVTQGGSILYAPTLSSPIELDGNDVDWHGQNTRPVRFSESDEEKTPPGSVSFVQRIGKYDQYLYALFDVTHQPRDRLSDPRARDHLEIALTVDRSELRRYIVKLANEPFARIYRIAADQPAGEQPVILGEAQELQSAWKKTQSGFMLEVQIPLALIGAKLGFAVGKVDEPGANVVTLVGAPYTGEITELPSVVIPGAEIDAILRGIGRTSARIWVVDHLGRVLSRAGSLRRMPVDDEYKKNAAEPWYRQIWHRFEAATLRQIYATILRKPTEDFADDLDNASVLIGKELDGALAGSLTTRWRLTPDSQAIVLSAAQPIWVADRVAGAVLVEETTNEILAFRNRALEKLFNYALAAFLLGAVTLVIFASRISSRIRRLRDQAEEAIDSQGRIRGLITSSDDRDEIGDLSRSFSDVLQRLGDYTSYLESMASRLSHEIRTPTAVVRSSLDNLRHQGLPEDARIYLDRAQEGVERLTKILNRMSEATRLEQTMQNLEQERFDLCAVVRGCVAGYQMAHVDKQFLLETPSRPVWIDGVPDLVAQMLDKLVSNAMDFSSKGRPIQIRVAPNVLHAELAVINEGPSLPEEMRNQLFESLVSVRPQQGGSEPHLGLGLYIVRLIAEFHRGVASLQNRLDGRGVIATVTLALAGMTPSASGV